MERHPFYEKCSPKSSLTTRLCVGSGPHEFSEEFWCCEVHSKYPFSSWDSFMPQKQPQPGSVLMASQQILWRGHHRRARVWASLQSGGKTHLVKCVFAIQENKCKGQIVGPVEINGRDLMGLWIQRFWFIWLCLELQQQGGFSLMKISLNSPV